MSLLGSLVFLIFACIWYIPVYKRQSAENRLPVKNVFKALVIGLLPVFIAAVVVQSALSWLYMSLGVEKGSPLYRVLQAVLSFAVIEELLKALTAGHLYKKGGYTRRSESVLIYGAVGLGFGVTESLLLASNVAFAIFRGVFALHVFFQFFMGLYAWEANTCRAEGDMPGYRKNRFRAFIVPVVIHALHDLAGSFAPEMMIGDDPSKQLTGAVILGLSACLDIVFIVITLKRVNRAVS